MEDKCGLVKDIVFLIRYKYQKNVERIYSFTIYLLKHVRNKIKE